MSKKINIYLIGFLFIFSLLAFFYFNKSKKVIVEESIVTPAPTAELKLEKFKSDLLGFEVTLPAGLQAEEKTEGKVVLVGDKILIYELVDDPEKCKGVCSIFTKKEDDNINDTKMRYLEGYWEELGEDNAQSFISYVIPRENRYLVFMLQELPIDEPFDKGRKKEIIDELDLSTFKKMVESVILF